MPGMRCAIAVCNNSLAKAKKSGQEISFYRFPKNQGLFKIWIQKCHREDQWNPGSSRICSEHFSPDDYERDLQAELLGGPIKKKLKSTAVPSKKLALKLPKVPTNTPSPVRNRRKRLQRRHNQQVVRNLFAQDTSSSVIEEEVTSISEDTTEPVLPSTSAELHPIQSIAQSEVTLSKRCKELMDENRALKQQLMARDDTIKEINKKQKDLEREISNLSAKLKLESANRTQVENALRNLLSKAQVDLVLGRKKQVRWSSDDISKAFAIRYFSKRGYIYLRKQLQYPLPGISSLQRWAAQLNLRQGVLYDVLRIMDIAGQELSAFERTVVLQFDEVKVAAMYEYDKAMDEVVGPHNQLQVVMVRTLFSKLKQPIYLEFDKKMTKETLDILISKLHEISYTVVACVSDCGGGNIGVWKELGVTVEQPFWVHESTGRKVFFFADAPHLLKLMRNWLIDTGFVLEDGTDITIEPLKSLVTSTDTEVNSCFRISQAHLDCVGAQRQNVKLAAQLLSHTVATALKRYQPGDNKKLARDTGEFIEKISDWFDIFNSYSTATSRESKKPFGWKFEKQTEALEEMSALISGMRCKGKKSLQVFQKGLLMSINSLQSLFKDLKSNLDISYICTNRLNQDALENFFSQLRTRGGLNDHPTPLNAIYRIRMIILGKNPGIVQQRVNSLPSEHDSTDDEYIMAQVISSVINVTVPAPEHYDCDSDADSVSTSTSSDISELRTTRSLEAVSEQDGLEHLAGWVAKKLKSTHPHLGKHTYRLQQDHAYSVPYWLSQLSFGGLMQPSGQWTTQAALLNKAFEHFHKNGTLRKGPKVTEKLLNKVLKRHPELDNIVAKTYLLQRMFIRIKYLNLKRQQQTLRKRPAEKSHTKLAHKRRKIIT